MATLPMNPTGVSTGIGGVTAKPVMAPPVAGTPGASTVPGGTIVPAGGAPNQLGATTATTGATLPGVTSISSGLNTTDGAYTLTGDFKDTYGAGTGTALAGVLGNLGTATDGAVSATNAQILDTTNKQRANIASGLAASGISADSSTSALAQGDFDSSVAATVASTDAGMELSEENTLISALQNEGSAHGSDSSIWDSIGSFLDSGLLGAGASAVNSLGATGTGTTSKILDTLSMFG